MYLFALQKSHSGKQENAMLFQMSVLGLSKARITIREKGSEIKLCITSLSADATKPSFSTKCDKAGILPPFS